MSTRHDADPASPWNANPLRFGSAHDAVNQSQDMAAPHYLHWRDVQLARHDAAYTRWREDQVRLYDAEYLAWRTQRHLAFTNAFDGWRAERGPGPAGDRPLFGAAPSSDQLAPLPHPNAAHGANPTLGDIADGGTGGHRRPKPHQEEPHDGLDRKA